MRWLTKLVVVSWILLLSISGIAFAQPYVDVNQADIEALKSLQGVGDIRAQAIIKHRELHGPFKSLDDLKSVSGIGDQIIDQNKSNITFGQAKIDSQSKTDPERSKAADSR